MLDAAIGLEVRPWWESVQNVRRWGEFPEDQSPPGGEIYTLERLGEGRASGTGSAEAFLSLSHVSLYLRGGDPASSFQRTTPAGA